MNTLLCLGFLLLVTQGINGQLFPGGRRPPGPFGPRPFGGGPPPGGPRGDGGIGRFLTVATRLCLRACTAINLGCSVLPQNRMTPTCKSCLDSNCPYEEGVPGFVQDRCPVSKYVTCSTAGYCPAYTTGDQQYFSDCLKCRDGCLPKEMKEQIQKRMKEVKGRIQTGLSCRDKCDQTHGCPKPAPRSCMDCVRRLCGEGQSFDCVHNAFGSGNCPTCKNQGTNSAPASQDAINKCRQCKQNCGPEDRRGGGPGPGRGGPGRGGDRRDVARGDRRNMPAMEYIRYLSENVIECLAKACSTRCPLTGREFNGDENIGETCMTCVTKLCPMTESSPAFDLADCRQRAIVSCGISSGCKPFPPDAQAKRVACVQCRDSCLTGTIKNEVRTKMAAAATCRSNCVVTSGCPKITPGACFDCIQQQCAGKDDENCRRNAMSSGKCSMCGSMDAVRRAPECLDCLRKCGPDDRLFGFGRGGPGRGPGGDGGRRPGGDRRPGQGGGPRPGDRPRPGGPGPNKDGDDRRSRPRRLFGGDSDMPFLPASSQQCIQTNCMKEGMCDDEEKTRENRDRLPQPCRLCRSTLCPIKPGTPMFDNNKCRFEAHTKCGLFFGCEPFDAETVAKRTKCTTCLDQCVPEVIKKDVRTKMMNAKMCRDTCRDTKCGDRQQCQACVDKICESSIYENCRASAVESCVSCSRNSETRKQCDACMDSCMPAKPSLPMPPKPGTGASQPAPYAPPPPSSGASSVSTVTGDQMMGGMSCYKKCESYGCKQPSNPGACQQCIKSVCDDQVYEISNCGQIVRDNGICPSCNEEKSPSGYDCKKCYDDCGYGN